MYQSGRSTIIANDTKRYKISILGLSEIRCQISSENTKLADRTAFIYSGHQHDGAPHTENVTFMLTPEARRALISFEPINLRLITAEFSTTIKGFQKLWWSWSDVFPNPSLNYIVRIFLMRAKYGKLSRSRYQTDIFWILIGKKSGDKEDIEQHLWWIPWQKKTRGKKVDFTVGDHQEDEGNPGEM